MNAPDRRATAFSAEAMKRARAEASNRGCGLVAALEESSALTPADFIDALAARYCYPTANVDDLDRWIAAFDLLPFEHALQRQLALFRDDGGALRLVFSDPFDRELLQWGEARIQQPFVWTLTHGAILTGFFSRAEESRSAVASSLPSARAADGDPQSIEDLSFRSISADQSPVVRLVNSTLFDAHRGEASDIHMETNATGIVIKYRIDGVLNQIGEIHGREMGEQVISRIKVIAELDIAERRVPQDGRFKASLRGQQVDFRVSIMPSVFGEDAVLRILDKQALSDQAHGLRLDVLGFDADSMHAIRRLAREPYGMLLVTGPTGSGKTTTLYAAITETHSGDEKVITIEDPVEYQLPGVLQIPVNEKKGLTFARGLRSILRHDPDKIMVGEIRDPETAGIAIQAALTGHLVFTTVHANNVFDVLGRFTHMEVDPFSFVAALNGIVAQRLLRVNCTQCAVDTQPSDALIDESGLTGRDVSKWRFRAGRGCGHCRGTGYRGRKAIAEILLVSDELRELIVGRAPIRELKAAATRAGTRFLRDQALTMVGAGDTTLAEINRVTFI